MADVYVEMSGDEAKLWKSYQKVIDQANKLDDANKRVKKGGDEAFGGGMLSNLENFAGKLSGIAVAGAAVVKIMADLKQQSLEGAQAMRSAAQERGQLAQIATSDADMKRLIREANQSFGQGVGQQPGEAAQLQFDIESAGFGQYRDVFARAQASGLVKSGATLAESVQAIQRAFGTAESGDFNAVASKLLGMGVRGTGTMEQLGAAAARAGVQAKRIGMSDEETMAALSVLSNVGGPEVAATNLENLGKQLEKMQLKVDGQSFADAIAALKAREDSGQSIRRILGSDQEAQKAYGILKSAESVALYQENLRNINTAQQEGWLEQRIGIASRANQFPLVAQQAENQRTLKQEDLGRMRIAADALQADIVNAYGQRYGKLGSGGEWFGRSAGGLSVDWERLFGDSWFLNNRSNWASEGTRDLIEQWKRGADALERAGDRLSDRADGRARAAHSAMPE